MLGLTVKVSTFDDIVILRKICTFSLGFKYSVDHSLILRFPLVTCTDLYLETVYSK